MAYRAPLQGLDVGGMLPRALPWADIQQAFSPEKNKDTEKDKNPEKDKDLEKEKERCLKGLFRQTLRTVEHKLLNAPTTLYSF